MEKLVKIKILNKKLTQLLTGLRSRLPELFVLLLCMLVLGAGVSRKEGFHMDELLSFELANGEFNPWIVPTQPQGRLAKFVNNEIKGESFGETVSNLTDTVKDVLVNRGSSKLLSYKADVYEEPVWIGGEQFADYITVNEGDDFNYLSVYFNVKDDNHPPLHFMLLHTMSSLFQGRAEPWMGCVINLICVAVTMVLLMKLGEMLAPAFGMPDLGRMLGVMSALLYGLSGGAMATTLLIRMYAVVTCLCVALLYLHVKKMLDNGFEKNNKGLIAVTVLGFWTQYFFLFYCLVLAAVTAVLLWCCKRRRELFCYVRSMMLAAVIGLCGFPFAVSDVFSSERGVEALDNLSSGFAGYGSRLLAFGEILINRTLGGSLWVILLLSVAVVLVVSLKKPVKVQLPKALTVMLGVPVVGYFLLAARMSPYLVDRYIMPLFPLVVLLGCLLAFGAWEYLQQARRLPQKSMSKKNGKILLPVLVGVLFWQSSALQYDGAYLYSDYKEQLAVAESYEGYPCICVYDGVSYYENLPEFVCYEKTLLVKSGELKERREAESLAALEEAVLLKKRYVEEAEVLGILHEKYGLEAACELYTNPETGDVLYLLKRM